MELLREGLAHHRVGGAEVDAHGERGDVDAFDGEGRAGGFAGVAGDDVEDAGLDGDAGREGDGELRDNSTPLRPGEHANVIEVQNPNSKALDSLRKSKIVGQQQGPVHTDIRCRDICQSNTQE